jgi:hypothetical protein
MVSLTQFLPKHVKLTLPGRAETLEVVGAMYKSRPSRDESNKVGDYTTLDTTHDS